MTRTIDAASLEEAIVRNGAPTLAGVMPANLFTFPGRFVAGAGGIEAREAVLANRAAFLDALDCCETALAHAGVRLRVLVWRSCGALIYLYRPSALARHIRHPRAALPLLRRGYRLWDFEVCLDLLAERFAARGKDTVVAACDGRDCTAPAQAAASKPRPCPCGDQRACDAAFPHEIGFFLGYPYADVAGFIKNKGQGFILLGPWKVYRDREGALAAFQRIRESTERCRTRHQRGAGLKELAVCA